MFTFAKVMTLFVCANIFIKKFIILFAFNLYKQINLFTQHIFANKYINTPYYIYTVECPRCLVSSWCRWCPPWWLPSWCPPWWLVSFLVAGVLVVSSLVPDALVVPGAWCLVVLPGDPRWLVVPPGILARIFTAGHPDGHATRLLSAAGSLASESKLQGEIDRCDYSYYQLFRCSFRVCFYIAMYRLKH